MLVANGTLVGRLCLSGARVGKKRKGVAVVEYWRISWTGGNAGIQATTVFNEGAVKAVKRNVKREGGKNITVKHVKG